MTNDVFQARVDERYAERLAAYAKARARADGKKKPLSEAELVKYALDLVIKEADRNLPALHMQIRHRADRAAQALNGGTTRSDDPGPKLGAGVPAGKATFQAKIADPKASRLKAIGIAYNATDSELVRRGFMLIVDEAERDQAILLQQLRADYVATRAALIGHAAADPAASNDDVDQPASGEADQGTPSTQESDQRSTSVNNLVANAAKELGSQADSLDKSSKLALSTANDGPPG